MSIEYALMMAVLAVGTLGALVGLGERVSAATHGVHLQGADVTQAQVVRVEMPTN